MPKLQPGTLNVRLPELYSGHSDFSFDHNEWKHHEDVFFERCRVLDRDALIMRSAANHHGHGVLELMSESHFRKEFGLVDGQSIEITLFVKE